MQRIVFLSIFSVFFLFAFVSLSEAQTNCLMFPAGSTPHEKYGASWGVFSSEKPMLVFSDCPTSGNTIKISIGKGAPSPNQYVWSVMYTYTGTSWTPHTLDGPQTGTTGWLQSQGTKSVTVPSTTSVQRPFFFVGYVCSLYQGAWKCGCRDNACTKQYWQLQGYTGLPGSGGGGGSDTPIPAPTRSIPVSTPGELSSALASAQPGDHIVLANGSYAGFTISKSGQSGKPIVIRGASGTRPKITGDINLNGNYTVVMDLELIGGSFKGQYNRLTKNVIRANGGPIFVISGQNNRIDHNDISGKTGYGINLPDGNKGKYAWIDHNYFHNVDSDEPDDFTAETIYLGAGRADRPVEYHTTIEYNLFENNSLKSAIRTKGSKITIRFNTNISGGSFHNRAGIGNVWESNYISGSSEDTEAYDKDTVFKCNTYTGGATLKIGAGDKEPDSPGIPGVDVHSYALNNLVANNQGPLKVGFKYDSYNLPAKNTKVYNHQGTVTPEFHVNTDEQPSNTSVSCTPARRIPTSEVGPNAPTAPRIGN